MSLEIYCGEPPAHIAQWIRDNAQPAGNPKTVITFTDGTTEEYDWSGEINRQTMSDAELFDGNNWIRYPQIVVVGTNVTSIEDSAFYQCDSLTSVTIPNSVTSIGGYVFSDCVILTSMTIGNGVTSIGSFAFSGCYGLTSITIPSSVTSIGAYAFNDCSYLTSVVFKGKTRDEVEAMSNYDNWGIDSSAISVEP